MENRFGFRDLVLAILLMAILVSIWIAMKQFDRQWDLLKQLAADLDQQSKEVNRINQLLRSGTISTDPTGMVGAGLSNELNHKAFARILATQSSEDFAQGDWHIDVFAQTVGKLTPLISSDVYQRQVEQFVLQPLARRDPVSLEWKPLLAASWQISEDGLTISFDLREDVRFSDGEPMMARDVVFTFKFIMNPKIDAPRTRAYYEKIESVTAKGPYRVVFRLREPYFLGFNICAGMDILAKHFYGSFTEEKFNASTGLLFGSGPYKLAVDPLHWKPGTGKLTLIRNDRYWGVDPAFNRLIWQEISDPTARLTTFVNGEIDRFGPTPEQYLSLKNDAKVNKQAQRHEFETITSGYRYIGWNQTRGGESTIFADKRVRQALTMLTDRDGMADRLMVGLASTASGPFHPLGNQADPAVEPWPYDPQRATQLLNEVGWQDRDGDGLLEDAQGHSFEFKLIYPASSENYKQMAFYLKDAYARAGILLEPDPLEWTIMLQRINDRQFDAITLGWGGTIEADPYQIFHSDQMEAGGDNYVCYVNEELDVLINEARVTVNETNRNLLWRRIHRILHEDQPYTFLFNRRSVVFIDRRIRNVQDTAVGLNSPVEWYVPVVDQKWTR